ncbi:MAG: PaaI family thioesterase [Granulosicoccus sp.]
MTEKQDSKGLLLSASDFRELIDARLPFAGLMGITVDYFKADHVRLRANYHERFLRPGGTIAGPVMMGLADAAVYALVLSRIGPVELAVTTQLSINFLRKPSPADVIADARMLKLGKRLAVGEASLFSEEIGADKPVAHVTATYSIPPPEHRS